MKELNSQPLINMAYEFVTVDRVFSKLYRDLGIENISEGDVIEWIGEALQAIGTVRLLEEAIAFIEVRNFQCEVPFGLQNIIEIARNNHDKIGEDTFCPANIAKEIQQDNEGPHIPVAINCNGMPENAYDVAYYRPYFDFKYDYFDWARGSYRRRKFTPVRLATSSLYNSLVCYHKDSNNYESSQDNYTVIKNKVIRFSFQEGIIAISYLRGITDPETGYPMVPDSYSHMTAIVKYINLKLQERDLYNHREGAAGLVDRAERDWQWYCKQAGNRDMMPQGVDEYQNLLDQRSYIIPRNNVYDNFFGSLSQRENRNFLDPSGRNNSNNLYPRM